MKKTLMIILLSLPMIANAGYQRNVARPVNQVVFGQVDTVRYVTQQQIIRSKDQGWNTLLGATVGGIIGHQFGRGRGRLLATGIGIAAGAAVARPTPPQITRIEYPLVEILIRKEDGQLVDVIQDVDDSMRFHKGDAVRLLYFDDGVRVDKEY
ncbi:MULTISPECIES: glycine zipper 2TM domain-containing protein [unclassified Vibrio]|uniref:Glycine zipper 2TM domain-containing protein n=1 Tax=Vibrio sp. HB236076 TaxID=3232307 RepID=A0AB39HHN6_9VIBR|nr:glycine zipper 2TM domain-containing protein [Vibrio sp. HB161653]MDP5255066.1 glycine zipper 2TM domain-containing protein [Vibrio sp. HB161653]